MWASDAPYQAPGGESPHTYASSIGLIRDRLPSLSAGDRQNLLTKTAQRVFFA